MSDEQMSDEQRDPAAPDVSSSDAPRRRGVLGRAIASMGGTPAKRRRGSRTTRTSRDPMLVGEALEEVLADRGWTQVSALAQLQADWPAVVGPELAAHLVVESLDDGVLVLRAESTAWATNVSLMLPTLREAVRTAVGPEPIRDIRVLGPEAPSWRAGPRRVKGRGPRDTYG